MSATVREKALAIHMVSVAFPGMKVEVVRADVMEETLALAGMRRKPKRKRKGTP